MPNEAMTRTDWINWYVDRLGYLRRLATVQSEYWKLYRVALRGFVAFVGRE